MSADTDATRHVLDQLAIEVRSLALDSRRVVPGDVFVAMPGDKVDARAFIPQVIAAGAAGVIWEEADFRWDPGWQVPNAGVRNLRERLGAIAALVYADPSCKLWMAGVTGTNGKTSCSHWIAQALTGLGRRTAVIGTLGNGFPGQLATPTHTTPDAVAVQSQLAQLLEQGAAGVAMEVSSHGLEQGRVNSVAFDAALFTNLSRDHLDFHGSMERYAAAKARLFHWPGLKHAVINVGDEFGAHLAASLDRSQLDVLGYGLGKGDIAGHRLDLSRRGLTLEIETPWGPGIIRSRLLGEFNAVNLLGVLGTLLAADIKLDDATRALEYVEPVAGRLQMITHPGQPLVVVDYAHTPDALEKVLRTLRGVLSEGRLICLFGCGGDRDPGKRPLMGEIATRLADLAIVTSDNPRNEDPHAIIDQIVAGAHPKYEIEADRASAIYRAIHHAGPLDIVLLAGKGHETYQETAGQRLPFDDVEVAKSVARGAALIMLDLDDRRTSPRCTPHRRQRRVYRRHYRQPPGAATVIYSSRCAASVSTAMRSSTRRSKPGLRRFWWNEPKASRHAGPLLVVDNTHRALGQLARYWRERFSMPLIAVTGSNGKTTVKDMLAEVLRSIGRRGCGAGDAGQSQQRHRHAFDAAEAARRRIAMP